jgi:hypothetical protein
VASSGSSGQSNLDKLFAKPQYLVHAIGHGTINGPVKDDWWFLYPLSPQNRVLYLPDGTGGTFTYSVDQSSGPFNTPREVCYATGGKIGDGTLAAWNLQYSGVELKGNTGQFFSLDKLDMLITSSWH